MNIRHAAFVLCLALGLAACGDDRDRGPVTSENRQLDSFDSIDMEGAARLEVSVGEPQAVLVSGRRSVVGRVETEVRGTTLHIESKPRDWFLTDGHPRVTLKITLPRLATLRVEGGNDVRLRGFAGGATRIKAAGAAHIKAYGKVDKLTVRMAGAGHGDFSQLLAADADVTLDGVGSVFVHPGDTLNATMNGVGAILYTGTPRVVNTRMNGLGTIGRQQAQPRADDPAEQPLLDPETLAPEYEDEPRAPAAAGSTEVI